MFFQTNMKYFFKIILTVIFFFITFTSNINSKPIPPGSGKGDVPANILILLDSSVSMRNAVEGTSGVRGIDWAVELNDGNFVVSENNRGLFKLITETDKRDGDWNNGEGEFRGSQYCPDIFSTHQTNKSWAGDITEDDEIWFATYGEGGQIIRLNSDGVCDAVINRYGLGDSMRNWWSKVKEGGVVTTVTGSGIAMTKFLEVRKIDGEEILFTAGRTHQGRNRGKMYVRNLETGASRKCNLSGTVESILSDNSTNSMTISNDGRYIYFARLTRLWAFPLQKDTNNLYCPSSNFHMKVEPHLSRVLDSTNAQRTTISDSISRISGIEFSRDESNVIYTTSVWSHNIQRLQVNPDTYTVTLDASIGKYGLNNNEGDPGTVSAADVLLNNPGRAASQSYANNNISVSADKNSILVGDRNYSLQRFSKSLFTTADRDTAWHSQYFSQVISKFDGAIDAIEAIVTDSSLKAGANFGFGHWNSGMFDQHNRFGFPNRSSYGGQVYCHFENDCLYYDGWNGTRVDGVSDPCLLDYCIEVGVSPSGAEKILDKLDGLTMAWGTDGNAFSQMAKDYFEDTTVKMIDPDLPCQLNYVIVISDGHIRNASTAFNTLHTLRHGADTSKPDDDVKTLMVGYGGSYDNVRAKPIFDRLARAGSCDQPGTYDQDVNPNTYEGLDNSTNCEKAIGANTPSDLKTEIEAKIRQIIAERLSFSAPSITATLEEGGSIYQAQFDYVQRGEWKGKLLRKTIENDVIYHDPDYGQNWDAGEVMKELGSSVRNIWTPLESTGGNSNYVGFWNNWQDENYVAINNLFEANGNLVRDFHNSNTTCAGVGDVADGNLDDIKGLINFVRGKDYFDYKGGCNIYDDRNWDMGPDAKSSMLADIYHSQLVEVGEPNANTTFTKNNQEAYWRSTQGYAEFKRAKLNRPKIVYAGSNGGMLHAFRAEGAKGVRGSEEWAFIPPMIAAQLPLVVNTNYEGAFEDGSETVSGTNAIFGVDGSPVVHDVFIKGLNTSGEEYEDRKTWRTLLFATYGRGGAGFSVLDITNPILQEGAVGDDGNRSPGSGPLHMFSIFNDSYNNEVIRVDHNGLISRLPYTRFKLIIEDSLEAKQAVAVYKTAEEADLAADDTGATTFERDQVAACIGNEDTDDGDFRDKGTNSCFTDTTFVFDTIIPEEHLNADKTVKAGHLTISQKSGGEWEELTGVLAEQFGNELHITFSEERTYNAGATDTATTVFKIETDCKSTGTDNIKFDYSALGETWSTPRIFRTPLPDSDNIMNDRYVAVMGGGMGAGNFCLGSGVYAIDLEGGADENDDPLLYGHDAGKLITDGPITILDSDSDYSKMGSAAEGTFTQGSPITNSIPASPIVITADNTDANWRGAMVYVNDLEGKITKLNFTSEGKLFDQKTIMNLNSDFNNVRYNFFEMDATIGTTTNNLWLFGGTGNFNRIADTVNPSTGAADMDNIVYGVKDLDFPDFGPTTEIIYNADNFIEKAIAGLAAAPIIDGDSSTLCVNTTGTFTPVCEVELNDIAWRYHLGNADGLSLDNTQNTFRKTSAGPTVYRGKVYFPIYEPNNENACSLGNAYVCAYNDECGYLDTQGIDPEGEVPEGDCYNVGAGILSKLVVFGDSMFANLAGPSDTEETLVRILASDTEFRSFKRSWRENF